MERSSDAQRALVEVDLAPSETQELALAKAGGDGEHVERFEAVSACKREEATSFLRREGSHLGAVRSRRVDEIGDVANRRWLVTVHLGRAR